MPTAATLSKQDPRLARPLFSLREAARFLSVPLSTLHHWAHPSRDEPLITTIKLDGSRATVPFIGFAEAFVLQAARAAGVPKHRIASNVKTLKRQYPSIDHLLAAERVFTDGAEILVRVDGDESELEVPRTQQRQLTTSVRNQLRLIQYAEDGYARRLVLPKYQGVAVVVDPLVAAGRPLIQGARVKDLIDRRQSGDTEAEIANAFGLEVREVEAVLAGEARSPSGVR
jgi:uncharacterized protein (DUF433 family)